MKVTAKKIIASNEIVTIQESLEVRLQIKQGQIVTLRVETEDGELQYYEGKTKKDKDVLKNLKPVEENYIGNFLEEQSWE